MTDIWSNALDANYTIHGVKAEITAGTVTSDVTVIDKTEGVEVGDPAGVLTVVPGACIRVTELTEKGLQRVDLAGGLITFNGNDWTITATRPRPTPKGEAGGELLLILEQA